MAIAVSTLSAFFLAACWQSRGRVTTIAPARPPRLQPSLAQHKPSLSLLAMLCLLLFTIVAVSTSPAPASAELATFSHHGLNVLAKSGDLALFSQQPESTSDPAANQGAESTHTQTPPSVESQPESSKKPFIYEVQPGDTLSQIAFNFGVTSSILAALNALDDPNRLSVGDRLLVPAVPGVVHCVADGESLQDIASAYGVDIDRLLEANDLGDPPQVVAGQRLLVPEDETVLARANISSRGGARSPEPIPNIAESSGFIWPATGLITTYFYDPGHRGIDIAADEGVPVYAADGGVVITAVKVDYDYGWHLIIDHGNGYQSLYGHLSALYVDQQARVAKGQTIGAI
ncbi:MAG: LysM peptidoglycan-binding domain-containing protein, partial [Chloroflexota bacterium]